MQARVCPPTLSHPRRSQGCRITAYTLRMMSAAPCMGAATISEHTEASLKLGRLRPAAQLGFSKEQAAGRLRGRLLQEMPLGRLAHPDAPPANSLALHFCTAPHDDLKVCFRRMVQALIEVPLPAVVLPALLQLHPARIVNDAEALLPLSLRLVTRVEDGCLVPGIQAQVRSFVLDLDAVLELAPPLVWTALGQSEHTLQGS
mmetsp:Transcript_125887/g.392023  ORF Transcript_125887/g.392023 Transcript_125887/m.392023 type:complete len:202 (+) Transcript_125887:36-641(+)